MTRHTDRGASASRRRFLKATAVTGTVATLGTVATAQETLTLGASMSQTGSLAEEGRLYTDSYEMTVRDVNERGGVEVGDTTYQLDLTLYDDQSNPSRARQLFQRLIQRDGVEHLLGPYSSGVTLAAKPVVERAQLPMVEGGGASSEIFTGDNEWVFGVLATAPNYSRGCMLLADTFGDPAVETVGVAAQNDVFSRDAASGVRQYAEEFGWDVVVDETFPEGTDDLSSVLNQVANESPEVFVLSAHFEHSVLLANQMQQFDVNVPMTVSTVGATTSEYINELGATGNYVYGTSQWDSSAEYDGFFYGSASDYYDRFTQAYDYDPDYHNAAGSAAVLVYVDALQRAGTTDPGAVRDAIAETDLDTCFGNVSFLENGANDKTTLGYQWQDQEKRLVAPPDLATAEAVYPTPAWNER